MSKRSPGDVAIDVDRLRHELRRLPRSTDEIAEMFGIDVRTARRYIDRLVDAGDRVSREGVGYPVRYRIDR